MAIFTEDYCNEYLNNKPIVIGTIRIPIEEAITEDKINNPKKFSPLESLPGYDDLVIKVWPNDDGNIPHFHVERSNKSHDCAIMIMDNQYFSHGIHDAELSGKGPKILNKWLMQVRNGKTPWDAIKEAWQKSNVRNGKVPDDWPQPDYSYIKPYKG